MLLRKFNTMAVTSYTLSGAKTARNSKITLPKLTILDEGNG